MVLFLQQQIRTSMLLSFQIITHAGLRHLLYRRPRPPEASRLVNEVMARHSFPRTLLSDRGPNVLASIVKEVSCLINTICVYTTAYHSQTDGLVERFSGILAEGLSMYVNTHQKDWNQHLISFHFILKFFKEGALHQKPLIFKGPSI